MATNHRIGVLSVVTLAALAMAGCSAGSTSTGNNGSAGSPGTSSSGSGSSGTGQARNATLTLGLVAEPASLDFTKTDGAAIPQLLLANVYQGLVQLDQSGKIVPDLAKSWTVSPDRKTYTFDLASDATFSNGKPFTADDAKFSIDRVMTDWTISIKSLMAPVASTKVLSPTKLQVTLSQPSNNWLYAMTGRVGAMFSRTGVSALATDPVGTGPYKFTQWNRGDSITLTRRDDYAGDKPYYKTVVFKYFKDPTALNNALLSGTINVITTMQTPDSLGQFEGNPKYKIIDGTTNGEVVLSFNNSAAPLTDLKVRQAIRYGINHKALVDTCWGGHGKLIGSMVPPTDPWYQDLTGLYPYDPAKAKSLLKESGAANHVFRLRVPTLPYAVACGQVVQSQLQQLGFKVKLDQLEFPAAWLTTVFKNADYDMSIIAHVEPRDLGTVFGDPTYYTRYNNPKLQQLLKSADEGTPEQQVTDMQQAAKLISQDAAADWLFLLPNLMVADKNVNGLPQNAITESFDVTHLSAN